MATAKFVKNGDEILKARDRFWKPQPREIGDNLNKAQNTLRAYEHLGCTEVTVVGDKISMRGTPEFDKAMQKVMQEALLEALANPQMLEGKLPKKTEKVG